MHIFNRGLVVAAALFMVACGSSSSGGGAAKTPQGPLTVAPPSKINAQDYPNVPGTIFGAWTTIEQLPPSNGRHFSVTAYYYVARTKTTVRAVCMDNGLIVSDLAGTIPSTADSTSITFAQDLVLVQDPDCKYGVPASTMTFTITTDQMQQASLQDVLNLTWHQTTKSFTRYADSASATAAFFPMQCNPGMPGDGVPPGFPGGGMPGGGMPGMPAMNMAIFAEANCTGASRQVTPGQCDGLAGFMVKSMQMMGQCIPLPQAMDAGQLCQNGAH